MSREGRLRVEGRRGWTLLQGRERTQDLEEDLGEFLSLERKETLRPGAGVEIVRVLLPLFNSSLF